MSSSTKSLGQWQLLCILVDLQRTYLELDINLVFRSKLSYSHLLIITAILILGSNGETAKNHIRQNIFVRSWAVECPKPEPPTTISQAWILERCFCFTLHYHFPESDCHNLDTSASTQVFNLIIFPFRYISTEVRKLVWYSCGCI